MFKKLRFLALILPFVVSCGGNASDNIVPENDDDADVVKVSLPFYNLGSEFKIKGTSTDTYYVNNSDVPFVDVEGFINSLDGFFDCGDSIECYFKPDLNRFTLQYYWKDEPYSYINIHWDTNNIYVSNFSTFSWIVKDNSATNYSSYIKTTKYDSSSRQSVRFRIGNYYFDILYWNKKCLVPFVIVNMLFCSQNYFNVYYTGESYYGYYGEIDSDSDAYQQIYINDSNGKQQSSDMRRASVNSFLFAMDYFYGLKGNKDIELFKDYINESDFDLLWSRDAEDNFDAMKHILLNQLDELHTRIDGRSIYSNNHSNTLYTLGDCGEFWNSYYSLKSQQRTLRKETLGDTVNPVRYMGDTAIITLDSFKTGSKSELYDSEGDLKDTAWEYDSYFYMRHCMKDIENHSGINDVVLDLSLNGGGNIGAMKRVIGFLSDIVLLDYSYDTLTNEYSCYHYKIDTDGDGYYDDDAYDQYRWTVLSSLNSFSAANNFICKVKQQNLAKIIGHKSGGGMCPVLSLVLADGTPITISSNNTLRYVKTDNGKNVYYATEHGISPDMAIPYEDYYNDARIVEYVDSAYSNL